MYGHEVIMDLTAMKPECENPILDFFIRHIHQSQHFHIGGPKDLKAYRDIISRMCGGESLKMFLDDEMSSDVRLPYESCWFDYQDDRYRAGMIAVSPCPEVLIVHPFGFPRGSTRWSPLFYSYYISVGKPSDEASEEAKQYLLGTQVEDNIQVAVTDPKALDVFTPEKIGEFANNTRAVLSVLNMFLVILSCKNITTEDHVYPKKLAKKRKRHGELPMFTYKTLILRPLSSRRGGNRELQQLWENRLHLCRGHFKTYTEDAPLFGKIVGRFWWQPGVRGRNKKGIVMKDYVATTT